MRIGPIELSVPFSHAGLVGYSDRAMRIVARRRGCAHAVTEAVLDATILAGGEGRRRAVEIDPEDRPLSGQLAGGDSEDMARAASILVDAGFDAVDLNFACPAKKNKLRPRAGRLLADAPRAIEILRAVRDVVPPRVALTVKMRKAFDDGEEAREGFFRIFEAAWDAGCDAVTVHGRTVEQAYFGRSDAEFLRRLKADHPTRTILGSGDVFTARDAVTLLRVTGVDGVSIARGAIGNPWIFEAARRIFHGLEELPPTVHEQREAIREHYALAVEAYGEAYAGRRLRKIAIRYGALHPQAAEVKRAFIAVACPVDWGRAIDRWYTHDAPGAWPPIEAVNTAREAAQGDEDPGARDDDAAGADDPARAGDAVRSQVSSSVDMEGGDASSRSVRCRVDRYLAFRLHPGRAQRVQASVPEKDTDPTSRHPGTGGMGLLDGGPRARLEPISRKLLQ